MTDYIAQAAWQGDFKNGMGIVESQSDAFKAEYSFQSIFLDGKGTNPVEIFAAALASCFSVTLVAALSAKYSPKNVLTKSQVRFEKINGKYTITRAELDVVAEIAGLNELQFLEYLERARNDSPVAKIISGVELSLSAKLK